jgi:predicted HicB family RNase H-like nuclease
MTMPKPKKPGRPKLPKGEAKGGFVVVRFNADDLKKITGAAKAKDQTVSEWVREAINAAITAS